MNLLDFHAGIEHPFFLIAGPCVVESESLAMESAIYLKKVCSELEINFIYKSSYDKANRTSADSFRGLGIAEGLRILEKVKTEVGESAPPAKVDRTITIEEVEKAGEQFANNVLAKFGLNLDSIDKFAAKLPKGDGNFKSTPKKPKLIEKRRQSNGTLVNFNIDRTKPFTDSKDSEGNTIRIFDPKILDGVKT